jgi:hypothetical protein
LCDAALALDSGYCFNIVKEYTDAVATHPGPIPVIGCPAPPAPPCRQSQAPITSSPSAENLTLSSTVSETYGTLARAKWRAYSRAASNVPWILVWEHETTDFEHTRSGDTIQFRAPDMKQGKEHAIWADEYPESNVFNGCRVLGDGRALIPLNGFACMKELVPSPNGYAKAKFTVETLSRHDPRIPADRDRRQSARPRCRADRACWVEPRVVHDGACGAMRHLEVRLALHRHDHG